MKGFTARTSRQTREENARMLALHDALLLPVVRAYGGHTVKGMGDALLAAFHSPTDAVLCAMAMQDRLALWNAKAADGDRIEVRIAVSQGELRRRRGELYGEALQLVHDAQRTAEAGEVVLTDAVYLSMNKSEVPTEIVGERPLLGGGRIRLRRAVRGKDARSPYGGRALARLGRLPDPALALQLRLIVDRSLAFGRKRAVWAAAGLLLIAAAAGERGMAAPRDPAAKAVELLALHKPVAALAELDKLADSPRANDPAVQVVRGKAEHQLGQLGLAFSDFAAAAQRDPSALDGEALSALADELDAETFPPVWRPALVRLLGQAVGKPCAPAVRRLLASSRSTSRTAALEVLELAGAATDADRLEVARADLGDARSGCAARKDSVRRLALVSDGQADALLRKTASGSGCGSADARDALRRRQRSRLADAH